MLVSNLTFTNGGCCRASTGSETSKESSEAPGTKTNPGQEVASTLFMSTRTSNTTFHVSSVRPSVLISSPLVSFPLHWFLILPPTHSHTYIPCQIDRSLPYELTVSIHLVNFCFLLFPSSPLPDSWIICLYIYIYIFALAQYFQEESL